MDRRLRRGIVAALVLAGVVAGTRALFRPRPIEVETQAVGYGPVEDVVANSEGGTVKSRAQARLGVERSGCVAILARREGARVRRGEIVLELDASTATRQLESARIDRATLEAALDAARAAERWAAQSLARLEPLRLQGLASPEQMDATRSRADAAAAELEAAGTRLERARSAVRLAEVEVAHHRVRAPFDGVISRRLVEVGEPVIAGQPVLELVSLDRLYVSAPIDERDAGRVRPQLPARVTLDAYPGREWTARVTRIAPVLETAREQNRTLEIELDLPPDPRLPAPLPGMTADVEIVLERREDVLRVPTLAIGENGRVLVAERGRATARTVSPGLRNWQWTEVLAGMKPGDHVITTLDRPGLKAGVAVREKFAGPGGAATETAAILP